MVFSSLIFLCAFLPAVLVLTYAVPHRYRNTVALLASLVFYAWGAPRFVFVLVISSLVDYLLSQHLPSGKGSSGLRRGVMVIAVTVNLSVFLYFKYMNFFVDQFNTVIGIAGGSAVNWPAVILPIGISFFTFQKLSYLVDVYRGITPPARTFSQYLLYVSLFPQLIAGPIVRYHDIADQLVKRTFTDEKVLSGFWRFALGLAKKVLIANVVGQVADAAFGADIADLSAGAAWLGALCYAMQIYFDFSGYSDMAIGLGRMLGFELLENFRAPYMSSSFTEFWRRWHISLSNWMREYLYIPLGGNRCGRGRRVFNLWFVFFLSGFWHGASWNFVVWGLYHGLFLSTDKLTQRWRKRVPAAVAIPLTFLLVLVGWVFFRAETLPEAWAYLQRMAGAGPEAETALVLDWMNAPKWLALAVGLGFSFLPAWIPALETADWTPRRLGLVLLRTTVTAVFTALCMMALVTSDFNPFIYFRF